MLGLEIMIITLHIFSLDRGFMAESSELCINSNIPMLASTPIEFYDDTREGVIAQVRKYARAKFPEGGKIRIV